MTPAVVHCHIDLLVSRAELEQVQLAAELRHVSVDVYVKRAINGQLMREGVDAVLLEEKKR